MSTYIFINPLCFCKTMSEIFLFCLICSFKTLFNYVNTHIPNHYICLAQRHTQSVFLLCIFLDTHAFINLHKSMGFFSPSHDNTYIVSTQFLSLLFCPLKKCSWGHPVAVCKGLLFVDCIAFHRIDVLFFNCSSAVEHLGGFYY